MHGLASNVAQCENGLSPCSRKCAVFSGFMLRLSPILSQSVSENRLSLRAWPPVEHHEQQVHGVDRAVLVHVAGAAGLTPVEDHDDQVRHVDPAVPVGVERADRAGIQEHRDVVAEQVGDGEVGSVDAVQVADNHRSGAAGGVGELRAELAVAVVEQDGNIVAGPVKNDGQVLVPVTVQVGGGDRN